MSEQKIWAEGFYFDRRENAPDFVVGRIGIHVPRFIEWLKKQPVSEKEYLNINVTRSKDGSRYSASLDTWQPRAQEGSSAPRKVADNAYARRDDVPYDDEMPF